MLSKFFFHKDHKCGLNYAFFEGNSALGTVGMRLSHPLIPFRWPEVTKQNFVSEAVLEYPSFLLRLVIIPTLAHLMCGRYCLEQHLKGEVSLGTKRRQIEHGKILKCLSFCFRSHCLGTEQRENAARS